MASITLQVRSSINDSVQVRLYDDENAPPTFGTLPGRDNTRLSAMQGGFFSIKTRHGIGYSLEVSENIQLTPSTTLSDASHLTNVFSVKFGTNEILPPDKGEIEIKSSRPGHGG